jgi:hypothetical protein
MATMTDARDNSTAEAVKAAQDAARRYLDESSSISRIYFTAWSAAAQVGLRTAFDLQNAMVQSSRALLDAANQANRNWFDQAAEAVRKGQDASVKLVAAGFDMVESSVPKGRI